MGHEQVTRSALYWRIDVPFVVSSVCSLFSQQHCRVLQHCRLSRCKCSVRSSLPLACAVYCVKLCLLDMLAARLALTCRVQIRRETRLQRSRWNRYHKIGMEAPSGFF